MKLPRMNADFHSRDPVSAFCYPCMSVPIWGEISLLDAVWEASVRLRRRADCG